MSQPASTTRIPSLRFPEFSGEWCFGSISNLVESLDAGVSVNSVDEQGIGNDKAILKTSCVTNGFFDFKEHKKVVDETEISRLKESVKAETIIISRMNTPNLVGANAYVEKDFPNLFLPDRLWAAKISKKASPRWVSFLISSPKTRAVMSSRATGTSDSMKNITKSDVMELPVFFPSLPEQTKIAAFLSTVDSKIDQLSQKKILLEQYKKGVMQQIFSQQIRFKADDGCDYPEWEEKKLGEVGTTYNGLTGKTADDFGDGFPYIQYKQIFDKSKIDASKFGFVSIGKNDKQNMACYGDIFFTVSSETPNEVGYASVLLDEVDNLYLNSFCFGYRPNKLLLESSFSQYLFRSNKFRRKVIPLAQGSTRYNISKTEFIKLTVMLPCLEEQTKIANFLSAIDSKLEQVAQQLEAAKQFKKGLLQQMFV